MVIPKKHIQSWAENPCVEAREESVPTRYNTTRRSLNRKTENRPWLSFAMKPMIFSVFTIPQPVPVVFQQRLVVVYYIFFPSVPLSASSISIGSPLLCAQPILLSVGTILTCLPDHKGDELRYFSAFGEDISWSPTLGSQRSDG